VLGELDLATTEGGQAEVGDLELLGGSTHVDGVKGGGGRWIGRKRDVKEEGREDESRVYVKC